MAEHKLSIPTLFPKNKNNKSSSTHSSPTKLFHTSSPTHSLLYLRPISPSLPNKRRQLFPGKAHRSLSQSTSSTTVHWLNNNIENGDNGKINFGNGLIAILQKALCTNNNSQQNNYRTVLTNRRESPDSGLELEQRTEVSGSGNEEINESNGERKLSSAKQQNKKVGKTQNLINLSSFYFFAGLVERIYIYPNSLFFKNFILKLEPDIYTKLC
ncbi:unnamed protein product [Meloidogyne enterolobii]|uniref:Uncharacterized protein n=1 Tax=Meloidogyne enterolobii TaxID=390850 RepID=A0ACB0Z163_MELEN